MTRIRKPVSTGTAVAALALLATGYGTAAPASPTCTSHVYPGIAAAHTKNLNLKVHYNSFPPTSGPHYYLPARWDFYTSPIPQIALVHNLEHGGIVIQFGSAVSTSEATQLKAWYLRDSNAVLVAPLPQLGAKIALGAWNEPPYGGKVDPGHGYLDICTAFDAQMFTAFVKAHRYKSGERFPKSILARGK